jgi:CheY-like chemotaxis protein
MKPLILFIDDDLQWLQAYQGLLEDEGYAVVTATNAFDARRTAEEVSNVKLVLTDLSLPKDGYSKPDGAVGLELLESIRSKLPNVPVIVLSAYLERYAKDLGTLGISAFISKGSPNAINDIKFYVRKMIKDYETQIRKELDEASTLTNLRQLIVEEIDKYSPIRERTIYIPQEGQYELIKPLVGFKREMENQLARFSFSKNVFLMMKFRESNSDLSEYMIDNLSKYGLRGVRADHEEWNITKNIYNPIAVLYCCKYGIALFDEPEENQAYSANVAYELGMMHYQNKNCLILRHTSLPVVPFDLIKDLYVTYERDLQVKQIIASWIKQVAVNP